MVKFGDGTPYNISLIGEEMDKKYLNSVLSLMLSPDSIKRHSDLKLVYTPLHGCGVRLVPRALRQIGFNNLFTVAEQEISDGNFPTVVSPNPEEPSAMKMALELAEQKGADVVLASDPDADRVGVAVRDNDGKLILINGNQTASLLMYYILTRWNELGKLNENSYVVKTIVSTELMRVIPECFGVEVYDVLTGFKNIAEVVRREEGKKTFICGGEESYGFNVGEFVRDKDSIITCSMVAECAAWAADQGMTLYQLLHKIYDKYGYYQERLVSLTKKGIDGVAQIQDMMRRYRENPPKELAGSRVVKVIDYNYPEKTGLAKSNVLRFFAEDGSTVAIRPSGTEPKIKFYFGAKGDDVRTRLDRLVAQFAE